MPLLRVLCTSGCNAPTTLVLLSVCCPTRSLSLVSLHLAWYNQCRTAGPLFPCLSRYLVHNPTLIMLIAFLCFSTTDILYAEAHHAFVLLAIDLQSRPCLSIHREGRHMSSASLFFLRKKVALSLLSSLLLRASLRNPPYMPDCQVSL
jgi:hypothetical protein